MIKVTESDKVSPQGTWHSRNSRAGGPSLEQSVFKWGAKEKVYITQTI